MTGSLGLFGRAKRDGLVPVVRPWIERLEVAGIPYHPDLVSRFLASLGEGDEPRGGPST